MAGVSNTNRSNSAAADGVTTVFNFTFFAYSTDNIKVYSVLNDVLTEITSGITKAINSNFIGGSVTFSVAPLAAVGDILIRREVPYTQETELADLTRLKETAIEAALNTLVLQIQQLQDESSRSLKYLDNSETTDRTIVTPVDEASLAFDGTTGRIKAGATQDEIANAQASATAAASSASSAASSASSASTSASNAASSASSASTSASNASASETAAATSETNAATSESNAATSESNAATSASNASTSEANAAASETAAAASETAAATSETNAATSESNASTSETNAAASAAAAASSAAEGMYRDVVTLTNADSPYVPSASEEGTLFRLDMTSGAITINLSALSVYGEDMKFAFAKVDGTGNSATINRGGSDTISGNTSVSLGVQYETHVLVGDSATGSWIDTVQATGIPDGSVTNAKLADMAQATIKGRASGAGTGAPVDLTVSQLLAIIGSASTTSEGVVELANTSEAQALTDALKALTPSTLADAFGGSNVSLAGDGYQKLPSGVILQWGLYTGGSHSPTVSFPIAFPTRARVFGNCGPSPSQAFLEIITSSTTNFNASQQRHDAGNVTDDFYWFAIGH